MRFQLLITVAFAALAANAWAMPILPQTFQDPLDSQDPSDVIGDPASFDIHYLKFNSFTNGNLEVQIRFNYGGGTSLSAFTVGGVSLNVGDLQFITQGGRYAFILNGHNGLTAGSLYSITGTQSASTVLNNPGFNYRPNSPVWADPNGATLLGGGSISVQSVGGSNELLATLTIPISTTLSGEFDQGAGFFFASATCGNDEITGLLSTSDVPVPEPATYLLLGAGLLAAGIIRRRKA